MNNPLPRWLALCLALAIVLLGGAVYGRYSQRWGPAPDMVAAGTHITELPHRIGNWVMVKESTMSETAITMLECAGYVNRQYVNEKTGRIVGLAILVGPPGPIAVHTPEICYSSREYDLHGKRVEVAVPGSDGASDSYWTVDLTTRNPLADSLRVYYGWSTGGPWIASNNPRYAFASAPMLYKLQLAAPVPPGAKPDDTDAGREFLQALAQSDWPLIPK